MSDADSTCIYIICEKVVLPGEQTSALFVLTWGTSLLNHGEATLFGSSCRQLLTISSDQAANTHLGGKDPPSTLFIPTNTYSKLACKPQC
jgi:hypothetical protein